MNTPSTPAAGTASATPPRTGTYRLAFILVTSLFFLWGFSYGLLDVLNKHFQETLDVTRARSAWLQAAYFGAYFLMAMPAAAVVARRGYKFAILSGLCLFAGGALLVIPSTLAVSFPFFLGALFIVASGLAFLETAANPYITLLGPPTGAERRLNLSQSFNGLGQFVGPMVGGSALFSPAALQPGQGPIRAIYAAIAAVVLTVAFLTWRTAMPEGRLIERERRPERIAPVERPLWSQARFAWGVIAQFCYVAAQVCVGAFFINYATERYADIGSAQAAWWLSVGMLCFFLGRFVGTALMNWIAPERLLAAYAIANVVLGLVVVNGAGRLSLFALVAIFFFMSIMFPTIFALAIKQLGENTERGSSFLIMSIVGGAIVPYFMGRIADAHGIAPAYLVPVACFLVVAGYGWRVAGAWRDQIGP
ncbi:MAG TPA: sugar MFS transporter [Woeseiaceae bacterium]|nr:sugar MFS transporter [Woeseiaceae bacterium]